MKGDITLKQHLANIQSLGGKAVKAKNGPDYFKQLRAKRKHYPKRKHEQV